MYKLAYEQLGCAPQQCNYGYELNLSFTYNGDFIAIVYSHAYEISNNGWVQDFLLTRNGKEVIRGRRWPHTMGPHILSRTKRFILITDSQLFDLETNRYIDLDYEVDPQNLHTGFHFCTTDEKLLLYSRYSIRVVDLLSGKSMLFPYKEAPIRDAIFCPFNSDQFLVLTNATETENGSIELREKDRLVKKWPIAIDRRAYLLGELYNAPFERQSDLRSTAPIYFGVGGVNEKNNGFYISFEALSPKILADGAKLISLNTVYINIYLSLQTLQ